MSEENNAGGSSDLSEKTDFKVRVFLLGLYHLVMILLLGYILIIIWPDYISGADGKKIIENTFMIFGWPVGPEARYLLLVAVAAAIGSYVHAATSFVSYVGNKSLVMSWTWWYILRPFIGTSLAVIFYFVIRGGLLSTGTGAEEISVYGIAAVAGLVGMFSKQATDKLSEVFKTLFTTKEGGDDQRKDKLTEKIPVSKKMIPAEKITSYVIPDNKTSKDVKVQELCDLLSESVTRIPILDSNSTLKYLIHQSIIYKFITDACIAASDLAKPFDVKSLTLEDFINYKNNKELVADAVVFVSKNATISEAQQKMEKVKNCQDVFVTETGKREEKILGWLTNVDIAKYLTA